ncbi:MAG: tetratricopeptide repeat protein [Planctomycetaceae bacterium]|jgi:DNA-directed RNA polymerase subunit alpha|nr:tetratricopeptide repeat protein [Planctomycetaceae bacterium]
MVTATSEFDLKQTILFDGPFGPIETDQLTQAVSYDFTQFDVLREAINELELKEMREELSPAGRVRLGVSLYLAGRYDLSVAALKKGDSGALALYYLARSFFALRRYDEALKHYDLAQKSGYSVDVCRLGRAEVYRYQNQPEESLKELDKLSGAIEQTAEYLYQRGATVSMYGNLDEAVKLYERAVAADKNHPGALFGLALERERGGYDEEALDLYKRAAAHFPANVGTLFNLGLLYEDLEQYEQAVSCYQRILDAYPTNQKARLFLKDAKASSEMHIDEEAQRKKDRIGQVLSIPVSDFELSVRSRNCLKSMGIASLGDLCAHTEQELLNSKNFGETSLVEIREMLTLKGLQLGQFAPNNKQTPEPVEMETLTPDEQAILLRPVTDLNLSVRARKCMNRLSIQTIGELVRKTADELLECKNFGVTSLKEIRERLTVYNIKLRGE